MRLLTAIQKAKKKVFEQHKVCLYVERKYGLETFNYPLWITVYGDDVMFNGNCTVEDLLSNEWVVKEE
jgi:hypothetical protein